MLPILAQLAMWRCKPLFSWVTSWLLSQ
jgi:hypothetical protein